MKQMMLRCLDCGETNLFPLKTSDGRVCAECKGHLEPMGECVVGIDLSNQKDFSSVISSIPPSK